MSDFSRIRRRIRRQISHPVNTYQFEESLNPMQEHSFLSKFNEDDVIEIEAENVYKVNLLRQVLNQFVNSEELLTIYEFIKASA